MIGSLASPFSTAAIMSTAMHSYQTELLTQAEEVGALKFGEFTLKSGRYASSHQQNRSHDME
jgi:hypothetical protein